MKRMLTISALALLGLAPTHVIPFRSDGTAFAQAKPYRVVFDLTSRDSLDQKATLRWIRETSGANPSVQVEVVMYGKGIELVMPERSTVLPEVQEALKNPNVRFKVCAIALKNNKVEKEQLIPEAQIVPDGIHEIVMKQQQGWGYIKVSH
jgi:uncharacterized protein